MMKRNMGILDRSLRTIIVAPGLVVLSWLVFGFGSVLGIIALVFAGVMVTTSTVGFCPTYTLFGISTRRASVAEPTGVDATGARALYGFSEQRTQAAASSTEPTRRAG
jgi:DUF2892 family protein